MLTKLQTRKLTKFFSMHDAKFDGALAYQDFENIIKRLAALRHWGSRSPRYQLLLNNCNRNWEELKRDADITHNKKVSLEEWLSYYSIILKDEEKYLHNIHFFMELVFEVFDKDEDGKISQTEWAGLLSVYNVSPVYAPRVFPKLDTNQDGFLSKEEVLQLIREFFYSDNPDVPANEMFGPY
ncbi:EF-hand domain-containing protein [Coleofasciculus sp.]|uniref:EF-hand domain-containing protein n=1 Tax=Coleofasciculus sp. TaxID=3100458 RepID=UPI003A170A0C